MSYLSNGNNLRDRTSPESAEPLENDLFVKGTRFFTMHNSQSIQSSTKFSYSLKSVWNRYANTIFVDQGSAKAERPHDYGNDNGESNEPTQSTHIP